MTPLFDEVRPAQIAALIRDYPLAWVTARAGSVDAASLLPLVSTVDETGIVSGLIGHMSRTNPLVEMLTQDARALILFTGPQAYVSPEHAGRRDWAPTWNYAQVRIEAEVAFTPDCTDVALKLLIAQMESMRTNPWRPAELGERYTSMRQAIIGFEAKVTRLAGRFKLGQDEADATFDRIVRSHPDKVLVDWMTRTSAQEGECRASG